MLKPWFFRLKIRRCLKICKIWNYHVGTFVHYLLNWKTSEIAADNNHTQSEEIMSIYTAFFSFFPQTLIIIITNSSSIQKLNHSSKYCPPPSSGGGDVEGLKIHPLGMFKIQYIRTTEHNHFFWTLSNPPLEDVLCRKDNPRLK